MSPSDVYTTLWLKTRGNPRLLAWVKQHRKELLAKLGPALLTGLYAVGAQLPHVPREITNASDAAASRPHPPEEKALYHVWLHVAAGTPFGRSALWAHPNGAHMIDTGRAYAMEAAAARQRPEPSGTEMAYAKLLQWLGRWDADFDAAQEDANARATHLQAQHRASSDAFRARPVAEASARPKKPREPKAPPVSIEPTAEALCAELRKREGSVIEQGVRVIEPNRFKSYKRVLAAAFTTVGSSAHELDKRIATNDVEILSDEGGYGSGRHGGERAVILEYVVHPWEDVPRHSNPSPRYVYVIELDPKALAHMPRRGDPGSTVVYVGQTALSPQERFETHKERGRYASSLVAAYGRRLFPRTSGPWFSEEDAEREERLVARRLRKEGFFVAGGK